MEEYKTVCHPVPCKKFLDASLFEMLRAIWEEVHEVEEAANTYERINGCTMPTNQEMATGDSTSTEAQKHLAEELTDVITACTTTLAVIGYNRRKRRLMQRMVNEKNKRRGYWKPCTEGETPCT